MEGKGQSIIVYLDTHVVLWLHDRLLDRFSKDALQLLEEGRLFTSPIVELELRYLYEIKKIRSKPSRIIETLHTEIGLQCGEVFFADVVRAACRLTWTRDPFNRLIVGEVIAADGRLVTKDRLILKNCPRAIC